MPSLAACAEDIKYMHIVFISTTAPSAPIFPRSALSLLTHPGRWLSTKCIFIPPAGDQPEPHRTVPSPLRNVLHQFPPCLVPVTPSVSPSPARSPSSVSSVIIPGTTILPS
ncbi:hypothetical protein PGTUg99_001922 [Puccinia graminis f. sp. tritici]|uniref:Uncharacterized protein n=1 Tax=Puccinia graminis f. sp. tritici TaxID=56615 RepID=A0A5B0RYI7_PUCGR|nr:hypothetical protein PGTUg99_001922 [Puccinia graminis f. sp. tritici]